MARSYEKIIVATAPPCIMVPMNSAGRWKSKILERYKHSNTGEVLIFGKGGTGPPIHTGYFIK
jgi:hypothetical protein